MNEDVFNTRIVYVLFFIINFFKRGSLNISFLIFLSYSWYKWVLPIWNDLKIKKAVMKFS